MKIILVKFKFGDFVRIRPFTKFSSLPKFVVIRYYYHTEVASTLTKITKAMDTLDINILVIILSSQAF